MQGDRIPDTSSSKQLDDRINSFFESKISDATKIHSHYGELWIELRRLMLSGGKRLRPKLTLFIYEAYGGRDINGVLPIAFAQELLHLALLIHDDIIDRDSDRYGVKNIAGAYSEKYSAINDSADRVHYASSAALLGGDLLISAAYEAIHNSPIEASLKQQALSQLTASIFDVGGGELLDMENAFRDLGKNSSLTIAYYKTASYSLRGPLLTGAQLACVSKTEAQKLERLAEKVGVAYQLIDDILGIYGDESLTGKTILGDIREGKRTYLVETFYASANPKQVLEFETFFGDPSVNAAGLAVVQRLLTETKAKLHVEDTIAAYKSEAIAIISSLEIGSGSKQAFLQIINTLLQRSH